MSVSNFPEEILLCIFSHTERETFKALMLVNRRFSRIGSDDRVYGTICNDFLKQLAEESLVGFPTTNIHDFYTKQMKIVQEIIDLMPGYACAEKIREICLYRELQFVTAMKRAKLPPFNPPNTEKGTLERVAYRSLLESADLTKFFKNWDGLFCGKQLPQWLGQHEPIDKWGKPLGSTPALDAFIYTSGLIHNKTPEIIGRMFEMFASQFSVMHGVFTACVSHDSLLSSLVATYHMMMSSGMYVLFACMDKYFMIGDFPGHSYPVSCFMALMFRRLGFDADLMVRSNGKDKVTTIRVVENGQVLQINMNGTQERNDIVYPLGAFDQPDYYNVSPHDPLPGLVTDVLRFSKTCKYAASRSLLFSLRVIVSLTIPRVTRPGKRIEIEFGLSTIGHSCLDRSLHILLAANRAFSNIPDPNYKFEGLNQSDTIGVVFVLGGFATTALGV